MAAAVDQLALLVVVEVVVAARAAGANGGCNRKETVDSHVNGNAVTVTQPFLQEMHAQI